MRKFNEMYVIGIDHGYYARTLEQESRIHRIQQKIQIM